jgi:hypothetical protein
MGILKHRPDRDGKLFPAIPAFVDAGTGRFALECYYTLITAAMRTHRAIGPADRFKMHTRRVLIVKDGIIKIADARLFRSHDPKLLECSVCG